MVKRGVVCMTNEVIEIQLVGGVSERSVRGGEQQPAHRCCHFKSTKLTGPFDLFPVPSPVYASLYCFGRSAPKQNDSVLSAPYYPAYPPYSALHFPLLKNICISI